LKTQKKSGVIYELLSTVYEKNKQYPEALAYYKKFHTTKASIDDIKSAQRENERIRETNTQLHQQKEIKKHKHNWDEDDKAFFNFITQSMQKLSKMIDNLLSLSRLDQDLPPLEVVNPNELLEDIQNRLHSKIQDLKSEIKIQKNLPNLLGHESLIGQVFQNLIDNALKYKSDAIPKIEISCKRPVSEDQKAFMQFEIEDNGKGIPAKLHEKVFELFSGTTQNNSNGIGLATCKKIVSNYGGNIWVKSKVGKGTTMIFTLPIVT